MPWLSPAPAAALTAWPPLYNLREELDSMIERRVRDFRLDSRLRRYCQDDIMSLCGMMDEVGGDETDVNICLQVRG